MGDQKTNGFPLKPIKSFKLMKNIDKPLYQYDKKEKEFVRVYYVHMFDKNDIKLGFNEFFVFVGNDCKFDGSRLSYRHINPKIFASDQNKYVWYY